MDFNSDNATSLFDSVWWHCGDHEPTHDAPDGSGYLQKAWDGTADSDIHGDWWIRRRGEWVRMGGAADVLVVSFVVDVRTVGDTGFHPAILCKAHAVEGDGGARLFFYDTTDTTSADNGGTILVTPTSGRRYKTNTSVPVPISWFGARADVVFTTCATTAGVATITVSNGAGATIGQRVVIRGAADTSLAAHLALTGVTTHYAAGQPPGNDQPFPYLIQDSLFQCTQTLTSPKQLHRYIEIPGAGPVVSLPAGGTGALYRGYVSDIGGTDNGGHKRSVLAAGVYRLGQNLEDPGADALAVTGGTGMLGGDNLITTITAVAGNVLTLAAAPAATFAKADCYFATEAANNTALELALTASRHVLVTDRYALGAFTNNHETATLEFVRGGQFVQSGEFATNGNKLHVIGNTSGITGGGVSDQRAEFLWCGPVRGISIHIAAGTPPIGGASNIQSSYADRWDNVATQNWWLTQHVTGWKIGEHVIGVGSYGMGGGTLEQPGAIDYQAGAGRALWWAHATQQAYCYDFRAFPTEPSQNGSGGNLGRGTGLFIGAHGTGGVTASWFRGGTIQGFQEVVNANSCDTTTVSDLVIEDQTLMGGIVFKCGEVSRFEISGHHQEDTGLVPRQVNPLSHANRNRFIRLGEAQSNVHAQYAAGAPLADVTGPWTIVNGPRRLRVDFGLGSTFGAGLVVASPVVVTITGTDYTGNVLVALFTLPAATYTGPFVVQGFGLDLFDSITSISSNINPVLTVDVAQPQHVAQDVVMHHMERTAGCSICIERIASDGFSEHHNGIVLTNENAAYGAVYFLATDASATVAGADLGLGSQIGMTTYGIYLANSSFAAVPEVAGLVHHFGRFNGGEFPPRADNAEHPTLKFASTHTLFMHGSVLDSRFSNLAGAIALIRGSWHFDSTFITGDGLNWTVSMLDGAFATWNLGDGTAFVIGNLYPANGTTHLTVSNYLQFGLRYWNGAASVDANVLLYPHITARTPQLHEQLDLWLNGGAGTSTLYYRHEAASGSEVSFGLSIGPHIYTSLTGQPTAAILGEDALVGSFCMRGDGGAGSTGYMKEATTDAGWHPITTGGPYAPLSATVQATTPLLIAGDNATHDLSVPRVWSMALGSAGQVLTMVGGVATWATPAGGFVPLSHILQANAPLRNNGVTTPIDSSSNWIIGIDAATTSTLGSIALTTDLGGSGTAPTVLAATGAGGVFFVRCVNLSFAGNGTINSGTSGNSLAMIADTSITLTASTSIALNASTSVSITSGGTSAISLTSAGIVSLAAGGSDAVLMTVAGGAMSLINDGSNAKLNLGNHIVQTNTDFSSTHEVKMRVDTTDYWVAMRTA